MFTPSMTPRLDYEVQLLSPDAAQDEALVDELARVVNGAYAVGEAGLWLEGTTRTTPAEIADAIRSGGVLAATANAASSAAHTCARWTPPRRTWVTAARRATTRSTRLRSRRLR